MMLTRDSTQSVDELASEYASALWTYLTGYGEEELQHAYELGRAALLNGLGVLDMVEMHRQAMKAALEGIQPDQTDQRIENAMIFFEESLSPFEITHRGYRDAVASIQRVSNFSFMACHEVKAPLTAILSSTSMLQEIMEADPRDIQGRLLANILNGVAVLKSRTDDMLDIAGLYAGALSMKIKPVEVRGFLYQVFERLEPEVKCRGMKFNLQVAKNIPKVEIDPDRIEQLITNLVQNAVKYASEGGRIDLTAAIRGEHLVIKVQDRGKGLPLHERKIMLSAQKPAARDDQAQGTGLGLMICRQIIEAHHGRIKLFSKPGKGSRIELHLPVLQSRVEDQDIESINS